jgi:hypothetical protein
MNINYFIVRLHIFILSPIFPLFLSFIIFIFYIIIYYPVALCDDGSSPLLLGQLKDNLAAEIKKSINISNHLIEYLKDTQESSELSFAQRLNNNIKFLLLQDMMSESIQRSKEIETSIKKIDPNFISNNESLLKNVRTILETQ